MGKGFLDGYQTYDTSQGFGNSDDWQGAFRQRMSREDAEEVIKGQNETPYSILGISADATRTEIKKAFRRLIVEWHPDRNQHRIEEAEQQSKKIIASYSILSK